MASQAFTTSDYKNYNTIADGQSCERIFIRRNGDNVAANALLSVRAFEGTAVFM